MSSAFAVGGFVVSFAVVGLVSCTPIASSQPAQTPQCAAYGKMQEFLSTRFGEHVVGIGVVNARAIIELFVSEKGTWTIVAIGVDGQACVMSSGIGWEQMPDTGKGRPT